MAVSFFESEADNTIVATRWVGDTKELVGLAVLQNTRH
jgi:hypothetical protein